MNLIDIHSHLDHLKFKKDLDKVIERARKAGVKAIITSGVNSSTNKLALKLAEKYDIVKVSFGIYPIDALAKEIDEGEANGFVRDIEKFDLNSQLNWIIKNKDKCIAIGECGLDYKYVKKENEQKQIFQKIIETAEKINKPIIVHSRKAELDAVEILESSNIKKIVMHCFNGRKHLIKRVIDNNWCLSIPPIITRLQHFQLIAELTPINQILTETDAPYLSPEPEKRNEPKNVKVSIKEIAKIKKSNPEETSEQIYKNYQRFF